VRLELDPRRTFERFTVGPANLAAIEAARRVVRSPGGPCNPLLVHGPSGSGKTHLLSAIGHELRRGRAIRIVYHSAKDPADRIHRASEAQQQGAFQTLGPDRPALLVDDVQFLTGRRREQEGLIEVWDQVLDRDGQIIVTSDRPPWELDGLDAGLVRRMAEGVVVEIGAAVDGFRDREKLLWEWPYPEHELRESLD
jgi:chromosomal replication initiator protein